MKKDENVKIIQIVGAGDYGFVYGLGSDQKIYKWSITKGRWEHYQSAESLDK